MKIGMYTDHSEVLKLEKHYIHHFTVIPGDGSHCIKLSLPIIFPSLQDLSLVLQYFMFS